MLRVSAAFVGRFLHTHTPKTRHGHNNTNMHPSWRGAPEYGEAKVERNSVFARIWRNVIKCTIFSMIVFLRNRTALCVILGDLT